MTSSTAETDGSQAPVALPIDDGFLAVVKQSCPTCALVAPALTA